MMDVEQQKGYESEEGEKQTQEQEDDDEEQNVSGIESVEKEDENNNLWKEKRRAFFSPRMIPSKLLHYCRGGMRGCIWPYIIPFLTSLGLTVTEAGICAGSRALSSVMFTPFWGYAMDATGQRKLLWTIMSVCSFASVIAMPFVGAILRQNSSIVAGDSNNNGTNTDITQEPPAEFTSSLFVGMTVLMFSSNIFFGPMNGIEDSFVINVIEHTDNPHILTGHQKMFAPIGLASAGLLAGFAINNYEDPYYSKYTAAFYVCTIFLFFPIPLGLIVESQGCWGEKKRESRAEKKERLQILKSALSRPACIFLLTTAAVCGTANSIRQNYITQLMIDRMNATGLQMGIAYFALGCSKATSFFFGDYSLRFLKKPVALLEVALFSYIIPYVILYFLKNPWVVILLEMGNGMAFAFFWVGAYAVIKESSHASVYVTLFTITAALFYDFGGVVAAVLGGTLYDKIGGPELFAVFAVVCILWLVVVATYHHIVPAIKGWSYRSLP